MLKLWTFVALSGLIFSSASFAKPCGTFNIEGQWKNEFGHTLKIVQHGCDSAQLIDNHQGKDQVWDFDFSGRETEAPEDFGAPFPGSIGTMLKTLRVKAELLPNSAGVHVTFTFQAKLPAWSWNHAIDGLIVYQGTLSSYSNETKPTRLDFRTTDIRLSDVSAGQVVNGQVDGFLQGANVVFNFLKSLIYATLERVVPVKVVAK